MKNFITNIIVFLLMFIVPFLGLIVPITIALGYFIDSYIILGIIGSTMYFVFRKNLLAILLIYIASIIVPIVHGDFSLMLVSIIVMIIFFARTYLLGFIYMNNN